MPMYQYQCSYCSYEFEELHKIDERHIPCEKECPDCQTLGTVNIKIGKMHILSSTKTNLTPPEGFKDVLRAIKNGAGKHSTIDV